MKTREREMRRKIVAPVILISVFMLVSVLAITSCSKGGTAGFVNAPTEKPNLSQELKINSLKLARAKLEGSTANAQLNNAPSGYPVIITLFRPTPEGAKYCFGISPAGLSLSDAVDNAVSQLKKESCFYHFENNLSETRIKVDLAYNEKALKTTILEKLPKNIEPGMHGLILISDGKRFFQLPEQLIYESWAQIREKRILGKKLATKQLNKLCSEAGFDKECWKNKKRAVSTFEVESFIELSPNGAPVDLYRGNAQISPEPLTTARILEAAKAAGDYLIRNQKENGSYTYIYYPEFDKEDPGYGFVRHVGTIYGFFQLYQATGEQKYKDAAIKALNYAERYFEIPTEAPHTAILNYKGESAALGSMAIGALALVDAPKDFLNDHYIDLRNRFGNTLIFMQLEDGRFYTYFSQATKKAIPQKQAVYFPGEAFLALVRLYEVTKDKKWLDAAKKTANYQMADFWRTGVPDNWVIQAMSRLYRIEQNPEYKRACYAMADYNWNHQWRQGRTPPYPDYFGGYDNSKPPRSTPAASRTEAADEALALALFAGDKEKIEQYADAVLSAVRFDMNCQYRPENTYFLADPARAMGAIKGSIIANDVRIDYCQHVITAFIGALEATKYYGR